MYDFQFEAITMFKTKKACELGKKVSLSNAFSMSIPA